MLEIKNISVNAGEKKILKDVSLKIQDGKKVVLMGPNGSGKSTFCKAVMGDPSYALASGSIILDGEDISRIAPDEKSKRGLFLAFQEPEGISGLNILRFLRSAYGKIHPGSEDFMEKLDKFIGKIGLNKELLSKELNVTLSGGEKKKLEVLQMLLFSPKFALIDEFDSGLDLDSIRLISNIINSSTGGFLIVSHNPKVFDTINIDQAHVIKDGKIVASGGKELISRIEQEGFKWAV